MNQLPANTRFQAAWHSDRDAAREYIAQHPEMLDTPPDDKRTTTQRIDLGDWNAEIRLLLDIRNTLMGISSTQIAQATQGKKRVKPEMISGPRTALEAELQRARRKRNASALDKLLPDVGQRGLGPF